MYFLFITITISASSTRLNLQKVNFATKINLNKCEVKAHNVLTNTMKNLASIVLPSVLGLIAGIGHGFTSHYQQLPFALTEQVLQPFGVEQYFYE